MAILRIRVAPDPVLKTKAEPVSEVTDAIRKQMDDMLETMYDDKGIGLAAPQVGISNRVIVMDVTQSEKGEPGLPLYMVNPEVFWESDEQRTYTEGCLSVPGQYADVDRPEKIKVRFLDYHGKEKEIEADDLLATCIQHEIDHLDGILFIDHLSNLKRTMIMKKLKKYMKLSDA